MKKIIGMFAVVALLITTTTGCLKDKDYENGTTGFQDSNIKGLSFGPSSSTAITGTSLDLSDSASTAVVLQGSGPATEDIPFTIAIDNSLIKDPAITPVPAANIRLVTSGVIKKGTYSSKVQITLIKSDELDPNQTYGVGLKIVSAPAGYVIAKNIGTTIYKFSIKNRIDGVYRYQTSANTSLQPNKDLTVELVTNGPNTVDLKPGLLGTYSNAVSYTVDKVTNMVTVTCPSLGVQTPQDPRSKFDPVTHNMVVFWKQGNGARTFEETFTYIGPRD